MQSTYFNLYEKIISTVSEQLRPLAEETIKYVKASYSLEYGAANVLHYHSYMHAMYVLNTALTIKKVMEKKGAEFTDMMEASLILTCLLHDIDHSFGKEPDGVNVRRAADKYIKNNFLFSGVIETILLSEFPRSISDEVHLSTVQKIFLDSDLIAASHNSDVIGISIGLAAELQNKMEIPSPRKFMFEDTTKFLNNISLYTEEAKEILAEFKDPFLHELKALADEEAYS